LEEVSPPSTEQPESGEDNKDEKKEEKTPQKTLEDRVEERITTLVDSDPEVTSLSNEIQTVENNVIQKKPERDDVQNAIRNIDKFLLADFGPQKEYATLYDLTFSLNTGEYTYDIKPVDIAKQMGRSTVTLGHFTKWNGDVMMFENGEKCWGGPDRSIAVTVLCSDAEQVTDVREPSKCLYTMNFYTPNACTQAGFNLLKQELKNKEFVSD